MEIIFTTWRQPAGFADELSGPRLIDVGREVPGSEGKNRAAGF
ncbi:hypothetical protein [Streptomyces sp. Tue6028]